MTTRSTQVLVLISLQNMISFDVEHGALTQLWGGTSPEGKDLNGKVSCVLVSKYGLVSNAFYSVPHSIRKGRCVLNTRARPANRPGIMDVVGGTSQKYLIRQLVPITFSIIVFRDCMLIIDVDKLDRLTVCV